MRINTSSLCCLLALAMLFAYASALTFPDLVGRRWAIGGSFTEVSQPGGSTMTVGNFAAWNGTYFLDYNGGVNDSVNTIAVDTCRNLYIGGKFSATNTNVTTGPIAKWSRDGNSWEKIGSFESSEGKVNAISVDCFNLPDIKGKACNCDVWIAGEFTLTFKNKAGTTVTAINVAKWDANDNAWDNLGGNATMPTGHGLTTDASAYVIYKKDIPTSIIDSATKLVHVAGAGFYYQYDKKDQKWTDKTPDALKGNTDMSFRSLYYDPNVFSTDRMFFSGEFDFPVSSSAGAAHCINVCEYNKKSNSWSKLTSSATDSLANPDDSVNSISMAGDVLYLGGEFENANFKYLASVNAAGATAFSAATSTDAKFVTESLADIDVCVRTDANCERGSITVAGKHGLLQFYDNKAKKWNSFGDSQNPLPTAGSRLSSVISWNYIGAASSLTAFTFTSAVAMIVAVVAMML